MKPLLRILALTLTLPILLTACASMPTGTASTEAASSASGSASVQADSAADGSDVAAESESGSSFGAASDAVSEATSGQETASSKTSSASSRTSSASTQTPVAKFTLPFKRGINLSGLEGENYSPWFWSGTAYLGKDETYTNIKNNTKVSTLGNDASENMQVKMKAGSWINVRGADFGSVGAETFTLRAKGTGTMEIRLGSRTAQASATINFSSTSMEEQTFEVDATKFQGVKNIYLVATAASDFYVDAWQFTAYDPTGIEEVNSKLLINYSSQPRVRR